MDVQAKALDSRAVLTQAGVGVWNSSMAALLKRTFREGDDVSPFPPQKRGCVRLSTGAQFGCLSGNVAPSPDASHRGDTISEASGMAPCVGAQTQPSTLCTAEQKAWQAVEELNAMFQAHSELFAQTPLLSYHSFTRTTKPSVFSKMCSVHSVSPDDVVAGAVAGPLHLRVVLHILQHVYQEYSDASITLTSFHTPEWLKPWCSRWGFSVGRRSMTSFYTVNAYPQSQPEMRAERQPPLKTILVPSFSPNFW